MMRNYYEEDCRRWDIQILEEERNWGKSRWIKWIDKTFSEEKPGQYMI